jgi:hypothetical protein
VCHGCERQCAEPMDDRDEHDGADVELPHGTGSDGDAPGCKADKADDNDAGSDAGVPNEVPVSRGCKWQCAEPMVGRSEVELQHGAGSDGSALGCEADDNDAGSDPGEASMCHGCKWQCAEPMDDRDRQKGELQHGANSDGGVV